MNVWQGRLVTLRGLVAEDAEVMARHALDSEVDRLDSEVHYPTSAAAIRERLARPAQGDDVELGIVAPDGRLVGALSIFASKPRDGVAWLGLGIADRSEWGKGYGPDAVRVALRHLFGERRYHKVQVGVYAFNQRSLRMFRRLGFVEEGRLRQVHFSGGRYWDEVQLGVTAEEFAARHPDYPLDWPEPAATDQSRP